MYTFTMWAAINKRQVCECMADWGLYSSKQVALNIALGY